MFLAHLSYANVTGKGRGGMFLQISAYSWARPAILVAGKGRGEMFLAHLSYANVAGKGRGGMFLAHLSYAQDEL